MTLTEMKGLERDYITVYEASDILECAPQRLRDALDIDEDRPMEQRRFLFPHCKVGNRRRIMRDGFLRWVDGTMLMPDLPGIETAVAENSGFGFLNVEAIRAWEKQMANLRMMRGE